MSYRRTVVSSSAMSRDPMEGNQSVVKPAHAREPKRTGVGTAIVKNLPDNGSCIQSEVLLHNFDTMGYIDSNLRPNETIILVGKVHAIYSAILYAALLFLVLLVAIGASADAPALIWFTVPFMVWAGYGILFNMTTEIVLTDQRFVYKTGVVARDVFELQR